MITEQLSNINQWQTKCSIDISGAIWQKSIDFTTDVWIIQLQQPTSSIILHFGGLRMLNDRQLIRVIS